MDGRDGGSFDAAPPPVGGLGNFKGVMLCNRPSEDTAAHGGADGPGPFRSMIAATHGEQIGLTPCRNFEPTVKKRGPSAALRRHVKWLKELQTQMNEERHDVEAEDAKAAERFERLKATFDGHREGVRQMLKERNEALFREEEALKLKKRAARLAAKEAAADKEKDRKTSSAAPSKPMWAMTEQEKDAFEEGEADDLINFAEQLDYEKFINDDDFRQELVAMQDRAGRLKKEQDAFKDALVRDFNTRTEDEERSTSAGGSPRGGNLEEGLEGLSVLGDLKSEYSVNSRRSRGDDRYGGHGEKDWDSSTKCGDERIQPDTEVRSIAESVLESNPKLRGLHSKDSIQKVIEKVRERPPEASALDLQAMMLAEGPAPVPVITTSADTQGRLFKPTDPSQLPYLYRSPAI
eukprot:TRINITY_DN31975_c0_g1_i1.p1 TRINITY_DN31975_c0_g1~~TRINITY_DN31975_c0_g1_i1.p1  ORF type:complete len:406 (-),score=93.12 TRINITY_DN31975_c0_g1_i1:138-1355(-)